MLHPGFVRYYHWQNLSSSHGQSLLKAPAPPGRELSANRIFSLRRSGAGEAVVASCLVWLRTVCSCVDDRTMRLGHLAKASRLRAFRGPAPPRMTANYAIMSQVASDLHEERALRGHHHRFGSRRSTTSARGPSNVWRAGELRTINSSAVQQLYFQSPKSGFYFLQLFSQRLFHDIARLARPA